MSHQFDICYVKVLEKICIKKISFSGLLWLLVSLDTSMRDVIREVEGFRDIKSLPILSHFKTLNTVTPATEPAAFWWCLIIPRFRVNSLSSPTFLDLYQ